MATFPIRAAKKPKPKPKGRSLLDALTPPDLTAPATEDAEAPPDENAAGFRDRMARENERFERATNLDYYLVLKFRTRQDRDAFPAAAGVTVLAGQFITGPDLAAAARKPATLPKPERRTSDMAYKMLYAKLPDPLADVEYPGHMEGDCIAETTTLLAAMLAADGTTPPAGFTDHPHYLTAVFSWQPSRDAFLAQYQIGQLAAVEAGVYVSGYQLAACIGVDFPGSG